MWEERGSRNLSEMANPQRADHTGTNATNHSSASATGLGVCARLSVFGETLGLAVLLANPLVHFFIISSSPRVWE
jgi:hypothetical protein